MTPSSYLDSAATPRRTPQSEAIPGRTDMVANTGGGYVFKLDALARLRRWLILGSEGGTYYATERTLTRQNIDGVRDALAQHGTAAVDLIVEVSEQGRAPKNDQAIYALAVAASHGDLAKTGTRPPLTSPHRKQWEAELAVRRAAWEALPRVCRTGTHLFMFVGFVESMRGWGAGLRGAIERWYGRDVATVAYQVAKYRQRGGWSHRDLLRLAHVPPPDDSHDLLFRWTVGKTDDAHGLSSAIDAYERAQACSTPSETAKLIRGPLGDSIAHEMLVTEHKTDPDVNRALIDRGMPMTALIRNLANLTRYGVLKPLDSYTTLVADQLRDPERLRRARVHPIAVLAALMTYANGHGERSLNTWTPVQQIVDALDDAFYLAFDNVEPTGAKTLIAIDTSGSMSHYQIAGIPGLTPRVAAAALAMVSARSGDPFVVLGFGGTAEEVPITPRMRLGDVLSTVGELYSGSTDCSLPMRYAGDHRLEVDAFLILTDNETWYGDVHPAQALSTYRERLARPARCAVAGMTATEFTIADPQDPGMLDVVGFDTAAPALVAEFFAGRL